MPRNKTKLPVPLEQRTKIVLRRTTNFNALLNNDFLCLSPRTRLNRMPLPFFAARKKLYLISKRYREQDTLRFIPSRLIERFTTTLQPFSFSLASPVPRFVFSRNGRRGIGSLSQNSGVESEIMRRGRG